MVFLSFSTEHVKLLAQTHHATYYACEKQSSFLRIAIHLLRYCKSHNFATLSFYPYAFSSDDDFVLGGFTKSAASFFEHVRNFLPFLNYSVISLGFRNIFSSFWRLSTKNIKTTAGRNNTVLLSTNFTGWKKCLPCAPLYIVYFDSGLLLRSVKLKWIYFSSNYSHLEKVFTQFQLRPDIKTGSYLSALLTLTNLDDLVRCLVIWVWPVDLPSGSRFH